MRSAAHPTRRGPSRSMAGNDAFRRARTCRLSQRSGVIVCMVQHLQLAQVRHYQAEGVIDLSRESYAVLCKPERILDVPGSPTRRSHPCCRRTRRRRDPRVRACGYDAARDHKTQRPAANPPGSGGGPRLASAKTGTDPGTESSVALPAGPETQGGTEKNYLPPVDFTVHRTTRR